MEDRRLLAAPQFDFVALAGAESDLDGAIVVTIASDQADFSGIQGIDAQQAADQLGSSGLLQNQWHVVNTGQQVLTLRIQPADQLNFLSDGVSDGSSRFFLDWDSFLTNGFNSPISQDADFGRGNANQDNGLSVVDGEFSGNVGIDPARIPTNDPPTGGAEQGGEISIAKVLQDRWLLGVDHLSSVAHPARSAATAADQSPPVGEWARGVVFEHYESPRSSDSDLPAVTTTLPDATPPRDPLDAAAMLDARAMLRDVAFADLPPTGRSGSSGPARELAKLTHYETSLDADTKAADFAVASHRSSRVAARPARANEEAAAGEAATSRPETVTADSDADVASRIQFDDSRRHGDALPLLLVLALERLTAARRSRSPEAEACQVPPRKG